MKLVRTLFLSMLVPGLGYLESGNKKFFYRTIIVFFILLISGSRFRLFIKLEGFIFIAVAIILNYLVAALHAIHLSKFSDGKLGKGVLLKAGFTITFLLIMTMTFANKRLLMGFDIMRMSVPVMQPTVWQEERFLVDTWKYKFSNPQRGNIVAHSFNGQQDIYLNRIIALGGDKIEIKKGFVILNDQSLIEPYILKENKKRQESLEMKSVVIPQDHYFVMGDNRDASYGDSRFNGSITIENIHGIISDIITSPVQSRIGKTPE